MKFLFRAKSIAEDVPEDLKEFEKGKYVYGFPIIDGEKAYMLKGIVEANDEYISIEKWCAIDPNTIEQCTGWRDTKNGREIFGDDTVAQYNVRDELALKGKVKLKNGCWIISDENKNERKLFDYGVNTRLESEKR